jgi:hypothetical protein
MLIAKFGYIHHFCSYIDPFFLKMVVCLPHLVNGKSSSGVKNYYFF